MKTLLVRKGLKQLIKTKIYGIVSILLLFFIPVLCFADIIPNPVQVKGIVPSRPVNIQMVSETVNIKLSMDSAWVECTFNMHNLGGADDLEIGFPMMSFYLFQDKYPNQEKFKVWTNDKEIKKIDMHIPEDLQIILNSERTSERNRLIQDYNDRYKPWYLWKAHFDKNEYQVIVVKYILPNGANHQNRFFSYLLSTGAGWAGKIEKAEININVINIPSDQIVSIAPRHYKFNDKQISWVFKNLKPTTRDDILIKYEMIKGSYQLQKNKADSVAIFIDAKKTSNIDGVKPEDIAATDISRRPPYNKYGAIFIFSKNYVFKNFKKKIKPLNREIWKQVSKESVATISSDYNLIINNRTYTGNDLFQKIFDIDTVAILSISLKKTDPLKKNLIINTSP